MSGERELVHIDDTTSEYQYRMLCLQLANSAQEVEGTMELERVMERANAYWEFVIGTDHVDMTDVIRATIEEVKGTA